MLYFVFYLENTSLNIVEKETHDIIVGIVALEMTLKELGYQFELGAGVRRAEEVLFG